MITSARVPRPTCEWQVCGVCNYDCTYCIQKKPTRVGFPSEAEVDAFLRFFPTLPGKWEVKMTGGEPFAFGAFLGRIVPGLVADTPHTVSVLTNLSASDQALDRFAELTRGRLGVVSASLHLEHTSALAFAEKAARFRDRIDPAATFVVNSVVVPGRLDGVEAAREVLVRHGLRLFPQIMKVGKGTVDYDPPDARRVLRLVGDRPSPRQANMAPSYKGLLCHAGAKYFVLTQRGDGYACRSARRVGQGYLGNVFAGNFALAPGPLPCSFDICPCTVPANRGMIEGIDVPTTTEEAE